VVIFGESGVGKSSIVNMLAGKEVFKVDGGSNGTTFEHQGCVIRIGDQTMNIWETASLNESKSGLVTPEKAFQQLFDLLHDLGGVDLLVFVMRYRLTDDTVHNYHLMRDARCEQRVPMVVAITGREFGTDNETWWRDNEINLMKNKMAFQAHAIGTANRHLHFDRTYVELKKGLQEMIPKYAFQTKKRFIPTASVSSVGFRGSRANQRRGRVFSAEFRNKPHSSQDSKYTSTHSRVSTPRWAINVECTVLLKPKLVAVYYLVAHGNYIPAESHPFEELPRVWFYIQIIGKFGVIAYAITRRFPIRFGLRISSESGVPSLHPVHSALFAC
jgi:hypothetical protein